MLVERFRQQIECAEKRYRDCREQREERKRQLQLIDQGKLDEVDLTALDTQRRIAHRKSLWAATEKGDAAPFFARVVEKLGSPDRFLERIIKTNELMNAYFLIEGARVRRSIGRVAMRSPYGTDLGYGTGSMISPRLMMTNNHVLDSRHAASNSVIQFDHVLRFEGSPMQIEEYTLAPHEFFITDEELDFTIVAVNKVSMRGECLETRGWSPLIAESGKAVVGERVNIIQHPGGEPQQLALRQNRIIDLVGDFLHYEADTRQGSSGSLVANDAWQAAALHHAGVPKRNHYDQIMLVSGAPWDGRKTTVSQIEWVANEGARISKIIDAVRHRESEMTTSHQSLFDEAFTAPYQPDNKEEMGNANEPTKSSAAEPHSVRIEEDGRVVYTVPVEIAVGIPAACHPSEVQDPVSKPTPGSQPSPRDVGAPMQDEQDLQLALNAFRDQQSQPYYDAAADELDMEQYYQGIAEDAQLVGKRLFDALHQLVKKTHHTVLSYKRARLEYLYPRVDLHPDGQLKSIYSGEGFRVEEVVRRDLETAAYHRSCLNQFLTTEAAREPEALEAFLADLEASSPFDCEHVVCQSWFDKKQPMKSDLHHLFTCESGCNRFRSNLPYYQFPPEDEGTLLKCGRRELDDRKFEPVAGKGPSLARLCIS